MKTKQKQKKKLPGLGVVFLLALAGLAIWLLLLPKEPKAGLNTPSETTPSQTQQTEAPTDPTKPTQPPETQPPPTEPVYTGWLEAEGKRYYYLPDGTMAVGQVEIDGRNHYFTATGEEVLMVNPWNFLPENYETDLLLLGDDVALEDMWVQRCCYDALVEMIYDCNAAMEDAGTGSQAIVLSAYRTYDHQTRLYNQKVQSLMDKGYSREDAERNAAMVNAYPGTSEHQLGLAVDIIDTHLWKLVEDQADLPAQKWLMENSWRYGFILRYPKGKTNITGIIFEPWHYRYVGKELAKELYESGMTMEEYFASLS